MRLGGLDMGLTKYKLEELIELVSDTNSELIYGPEDVRGMTITKEIIPTKADVTTTDLSRFLVVRPGEFIYNPRTHGKRIGFGYNNTNDTFIISWNNIAFKVKAEMKEIVLADYLFLHFKLDEWDREACFQAWGSSTEVFSWGTLCDMEIELPTLVIQQKYVDVYNAMLANQKSYEYGLEDLKLVCDAYIENLRRIVPCEMIGPYIRQCCEKNINNEITLFQGVNVDHIFIDPKRIADDSENGNIVRTGQFAFNKVMKAHNTKLPIAFREGPDCVVSNSYQVFEVINEKKLLPKYLLLWLNRDETQRYAGFISFGTTRDIFTFEDLREISIPLPDIKIQGSIVDIFSCYQIRCEINEKLKTQIKNICPILIKGSIEEARNTKEV